MPHTIVLYTDPHIRDKTRPYGRAENVARLYARMKKAMHEYDGIGIAAPQIGEPLRIFLVAKELFDEIKFPSDIFINPKIIKKSFKRDVMEEGCLSVPGVIGLVSRSLKITIEAYDTNWKKFRFSAKGLPARVLQHELDHLDGMLFIDKAEKESLYEMLYDKEGKPILRPWKVK